MTVFETNVMFFAEGEEYGSERYFVEAESEEEANSHALLLSEGSQYFDDRIDFNRGSAVYESDLDVDNIPEDVVIYRANGSAMAPA